MESVKLVKLHDHGTHKPVYVNPAYVTFITQSPDKNGGTIIGLVADDLGCETDEGPDEVAKLVAGSPAAPEEAVKLLEAQAEKIEPKMMESPKQRARRVWSSKRKDVPHGNERQERQERQEKQD